MSKLSKTNKETVDKCTCASCGKAATISWLVLLFCGLGLILPNQMQPIFQYSFLGISVNVVVGAVAVVLALNFLFKD